ncbi:hypothetical protein Tco_1349414 [Tanacetum coccineum]
MAILTNEDDTVNKGKEKIEKVEGVKKEPVPRDLPIVNPYVEPIVPPILFSGHLKEQEDEAQAFRTLKGLKKQEPINEEDAVKLNDRCLAILQNLLPPKENDLGSFTLPCLIDAPYINLESVCMIGFSKETHEEESLNVLKISEDLFSYDSPLCIKLNKFNYLLPTGKDIFTCDINVHVTDSSRKDYHRMISLEKAKQEMHCYDDERIKIPWKDMPFEDWNKFLLGVKPNNIKEVAVDCTGIMAEIDTDRRAQGAT